MSVRDRWSSRLSFIKRLTDRRGQAEEGEAAANSTTSSDTVLQDGGNHLWSSQRCTTVNCGIISREKGEEPSALNPRPTFVGTGPPTRKTPRTPSFSSMMDSTRSIPAPAPLDATDMSQPCPPSSTLTRAPSPLLPVCFNHGKAYSYHEPTTPPTSSIWRPSIFQRVFGILKGIAYAFVDCRQYWHSVFDHPPADSALRGNGRMDRDKTTRCARCEFTAQLYPCDGNTLGRPHRACDADLARGQLCEAEGEH